MSGNHSDSESSLSDWELVAKGDGQESGGTDNESNSSGSDFVHLDDMVVSYHSRRNSPEKVLGKPDDDFANTSEETVMDRPTSGEENVSLPELHYNTTKEEIPPNPSLPSDSFMTMRDPEHPNLACPDPVQDPLSVQMLERTTPQNPTGGLADEMISSQCRMDEFDDEQEGGDTVNPEENKKKDLYVPVVDINTESEESAPKSEECRSQIGNLELDSPILGGSQLESEDMSRPEILETAEESDNSVSDESIEEIVPPDQFLEAGNDDENGSSIDGDAMPGASFMEGIHFQLLKTLHQGSPALETLADTAEAEDHKETESRTGDGAVDDSDHTDGIEVIQELKDEISLSDRSAKRQLPPLARRQDSSDDEFVKLDAYHVLEKEHSVDRASITSSGSSVSSRFSFIQHRDDDESLPESDISLVQDDLDLSNVAVDQITLDDSTKIRQYKHKPNTSLNFRLSLIAGLVLALGIGVGIGHAIGSTRASRYQSAMHQGYQEKLKTMREDLSACSQSRGTLEAMLFEYEKGELNAVLKGLQSSVDNLERENKRLVQQTMTKTRDVGRLSSLNLALVTDVENLTQHMFNLSLMMEELKAENKFSENLKSDLASANVALLAQVSGLQHTVNELSSRVVELKREKDQINAEKDQERSKMQERLNIVDSELVRAEQHKSELHMQISDLSDELLRAKKSLNDLRDHRQSMQEDKNAFLNDLKTRLNTVMMENSDMKSEISRLKYNEHPANPDKSLDLKKEVNALKYEIYDLMKTVSKSRYARNQPPADLGNQELMKLLAENDQLKKKLNETTLDLKVEHGRAQMWETLFLTERAEKAKINGTSKEKNFMDCLGVVFGHFNISKFSTSDQNGSFTNFTDAFVDKMSFLYNATKNINLTSYLEDSWVMFYNFTRSNDFEDALRYAEDSYENMQTILLEKWKSFQNYTSSENFHQHVNKTKDVIQQMKETVDHTISKVQNFSNSDHVQDYINKTRETMSQLSLQIKETWSRLKNISVDLYHSHGPTVREVQKGVTETLFEFGKSIKDSFQQFGHNFHHGKGKYPHPSKNHQAHSEKPKYPSDKDQAHSEKPKHGKGKGRYRTRGRDDNEMANIPPLNHEVHEKMGFKFRKADRKKMYKKFEKLKKSVTKLSKKKWYKLRGSDRKDIYDNLVKFSLEFGLYLDKKHSKEWLKCQLKWWHVDRHDIVDVDVYHQCRKRMADWQKDVTKKMLRDKVVEHFDEKIHIIIRPEEADQHEGGNAKGDEDPMETNNQPVIPDEPVIPDPPSFSEPLGIIPDEDNSTVFEVPAHEMEQEEPRDSTGDWYIRRMEGREDKHHDPKWYFRRAEVREDSRHSTDWIFNRAKDREKMHEKQKHTNRQSIYGSTKRRQNLNGGEPWPPCQKDGIFDGFDPFHHGFSEPDNYFFDENDFDNDFDMFWHGP